MRLPRNIPKSALNPQRKDRLLTQHEINFVRRFQLEWLWTHNHQPFCGILRKEDFIDLSHTIFIGAANECIALYDPKPLGRGAFGTVYFGINCDTGKPQAVKVQTFDDDDAVALSNSDHEIEVLDHLGRLIDELEIAQDNETMTAYAQPLCYGRTYFDEIYRIKDDYVTAKRDIELPDKISMALSALLQVQKLHDQGYLHCDIKLLNLMWDRRLSKANLIDFGASLKLQSTNKARGDLAGTELYLAPEYIAQFNNSKINYTPKGEVYALGVCLLQIFSDNTHLPAPRNMTVFYTLEKQKSGVAPAFDALCEDLPGKKHRKYNKSIQRLLKNMLEIDPEQRIDLKSAMAEMAKIRRQYEAGVSKHRLPFTHLFGSKHSSKHKHRHR